MDTSALPTLITGGLFVDVILAFMVAEGIVLVAFHLATGRGIAPAAVVANLLAGGGLLLALRAMLGGWGLPAVAACFALSLAAHVTDLQRRWRS
jgi:hypothetical protein